MVPEFRPCHGGSREIALAAGGELSEERIGAVGSQRMHEGGGAGIALGAGERTAVPVAGSAGERERTVDDAHGGPADEGLGALRLGEQIRPALGGAGRAVTPQR